MESTSATSTMRRTHHKKESSDSYSDEVKRGGIGGFVASAKSSWLVTFLVVFTGVVSVGTLLFSNGLQAHTGSLHALRTGPDPPGELGVVAPKGESPNFLIIYHHSFFWGGPIE